MLIRISLLDQAIVSGGTFVLSILLIRKLGIEAFGAYTLLWGALQLLMAIQGSLCLAPVQSLGESLRQRHGERYLYAVFAQQQMLAILAAASAFMAVGFFASGTFDGWMPIRAAAACAAYFALTQEFFRRLQLATGRSWFEIIAGDLARYAGPIVLLFLVTGPTSIALADVFLFISAACLVTIAINAGYFKTYLGRGRDVQRDVVWAHWGFVRWLMPSIVLQWINANLVFYSVGWIYGEGLVGVLRMAQIMALPFLLILEALENVTPSQVVARFRSGGLGSGERHVARIALWLFIAYIAFLAAVLPFTDLWLVVIFGARAASVPHAVVWMFCVTPALVSATYCVNVLHRSLGATRAVFMAEAAGSAVTLTGATVLISRGDYWLAVVVMIAAMSTRLAVLAWLYHGVRRSALEARF